MRAMNRALASACALAALLCARPASAQEGYLSGLVAVKEVTATSTYAAKKGDKVKDRYAPWRVLAPKQDPKYPADPCGGGGGPGYLTAWCEGKPDEGIGEGVTITLADPMVVDSVYLGPGVWHPKWWKDNNQPTQLEVGASDGRKWTVDVPAADAENAEYGDPWQGVSQDIGGKPIASLTVKIAAVKKGKMNDSCITLMYVAAGETGFLPAIGMSAEAVKALKDTAAAFHKALSECDGAALAGMARFPLKFARAPSWDEQSYKPKAPKPRTFAGGDAFTKACKAGGETFVDLPEEDAYVKIIAPDKVDLKARGDGPRPQVFHFLWKDSKWTLTGIDWTK